MNEFELRTLKEEYESGCIWCCMIDNGVPRENYSEFISIVLEKTRIVANSCKKCKYEFSGEEYMYE